MAIINYLLVAKVITFINYLSIRDVSKTSALLNFVVLTRRKMALSQLHFCV